MGCRVLDVDEIAVPLQVLGSGNLIMPSGGCSHHRHVLHSPAKPCNSGQPGEKQRKDRESAPGSLVATLGSGCLHNSDVHRASICAKSHAYELFVVWSTTTVALVFLQYWDFGGMSESRVDEFFAAGEPAYVKALLSHAMQ